MGLRDAVGKGSLGFSGLALPFLFALTPSEHFALLLPWVGRLPFSVIRVASLAWFRNRQG